MRSASRSARFLPATNSARESAASIMCRTRTRSSSSILDLGRSNHLIPEETAEVFRSPQIHGLPPQHCGHLGFHLSQSEEARLFPRLELNQEIDVTLGPGIASEEGSKERKTSYVVFHAESGYVHRIGLQVLVHVCRPSQGRGQCKSGSPRPLRWRARLKVPSSPGRTRTSDLVVNSHPLYRLSYRGK